VCQPFAPAVCGTRTGSVGLGSYLRAVGQVGSGAANRKAGRRMAAVTGTSRGGGRLVPLWP
jgi:hypothetical protein